jgi:hypothetical protein
MDINGQGNNNVMLLINPHDLLWLEIAVKEIREKLKPTPDYKPELNWTCNVISGIISESREPIVDRLRREGLL